MNEVRELRVVLSAAAAAAFEGMVARMKEEAPTIKVQPSHFVSFLLVDFLAAHFDKDKAVLIAEFFDSDAYFDAARKRAKGSDNYEDQMAAALMEARKIKERRRHTGLVRRRAQKERSGESA